MDSTLYEEVSKVIKKAKEDPQFFHDLFFNTEKAISKLDVDRTIKGRLLSISPENALAELIFPRFGDIEEGDVLYARCNITCCRTHDCCRKSVLV
jgi:hypothetical protein